MTETTDDIRNGHPAVDLDLGLDEPTASPKEGCGMRDIIDLSLWRSRNAQGADDDSETAAMIALVDDLLALLSDCDLPARSLVAVTAIVLLGRFGEKLPDDVAAALEVCRK